MWDQAHDARLPAGTEPGSVLLGTRKPGGRLLPLLLMKRRPQEPHGRQAQRAGRVQ